MYTYSMKFRLLNPHINLDEIKDSLSVSLENAKEKYNSIYIYKNGTGRVIKSIGIDSQHISIILDSTEKLYYPSKAISKFSRILVSSGNVDDLIYNKRLFACDGVEESCSKVIISDSQLLGIVAEWIIDAPKDNPLIQKRKREAIEQFKDNIQEILSDEEKIEDWGL